MLLYSILTGLAAAAPAEEKRLVSNPITPTVQLQYVTVVGAGGLVESFKGIPFAKPPVGDLRLRAPVPITTNQGTFMATGVPNQCPQFLTSTNSSGSPAQAQLNQALSGTNMPSPAGSEDCLTLNIFRPQGLTSDSNLPVLFW